jgi:hypothetical protein
VSKEQDKLLGVTALRSNDANSNFGGKSKIVIGILLGMAICSAGYLIFVWGKTSSKDDTPVPEVGRKPSASSPILPKIATKQLETRPTEPAFSSVDLVGIWAPLPNGCGTGFGVTYTSVGRYSEGDEYTGEEGSWKMVSDRIERRKRLGFETKLGATSDDQDERLVKAVDQTTRLQVTWLDEDELTIVTSHGKFRYVKCPDGRSVFEDGAVFESPI